jgi:hypothetical protein
MSSIPSEVFFPVYAFSDTGEEWVSLCPRETREKAKTAGENFAAKGRNVRLVGIARYVLEVEVEVTVSEFPAVATLPWPDQGALIDEVILKGGHDE